MPLTPVPRSSGASRRVQHARWRRAVAWQIWRLTRRRQVTVSLAAVGVGLAVGLAALAFRLAILEIQFLFFGTRAEDLAGTMGDLPWWQILLAPAAGGVIVGVILQRLGKERPQGIPEVIDARARGGGRMETRPALVDAALSATSLGAGASAGREAPIVHLGGAIASLFARRLHLPQRYSRTLLGCGAAAAVSASFNAPIAGVLFAFEIILGSYALRAMAPVALAAVTGTLVTRTLLGEDPAFQVPEPALVSYLEMPAFVALGLLSGLLAILFIQSLKLGDGLARQIPMPLMARPVVGGLLIGLLALETPEILGVGYGAIDAALRETYALSALLLLIGVKLLATAITFASRFGGGIFTPSIYVGAMAGGGFGIALGQVFPDQVTGFSFYAMVGMGSVAAAVLGAPLSTTLIAFELTGGYSLTIALLVSASIATLLTQTLLGHSFFQWKLAQRGLDLTGGSYTAVLKTIKVRRFMDRRPGPDPRLDDSLAAVTPDTSLEDVLILLEEGNLDSVPVLDPDRPGFVLGTVTYTQALRTYKNALIRTNIEEHQ
ncbi:MAG: chloride channel protein [Alphaproteobacteria bacterium]